MHEIHIDGISLVYIPMASPAVAITFARCGGDLEIRTSRLNPALTALTALFSTYASAIAST
jgi:hypothetical protein